MKILSLFLALLSFMYCQSPGIEELGAQKATERIRELQSRKRWNRLIESAEKFRVAYPYAPSLSRVILAEADAYFATGQFLDAAGTYQEYLIKFPHEEEAARASFRIAACYDRLSPELPERDSQNRAAAITQYETFLDAYPDHGLATEAKRRKRILTLRNLKALLFKARFYLKRAQLQSAIIVYEGVLNEYADQLKTVEKKEIYTDLQRAYSQLAEEKAKHPEDLQNQLTVLLSDEELKARAEQYAQKSRTGS